MKYLLVVVTVLFFAVYGFELYLPTSSGVFEISSGMRVDKERWKW